MRMKRCSKCRQLLSLDCFYKNKSNKDGLHKQCKNCHGQWQREHRSRNKERIKQRAREYHNKNKERLNRQKREYILKIKLDILNHYAGGPPKCACCSDSHIEFLGIDHIDGGGAKHRKEVGSGSQFYHWIRRNNYPEGFRVLCQNCNTSFGLFGYCPHESNKILKGGHNDQK